MVKSVGVTMFFNLKELPDALPNVRSPEFYVENARPTLGVRYPLVIFCDKVTRPWIEKMRNECAPGETTHYVEKNITEYDIYKQNHSIITENRKKGPGYKQWYERNTPSYCITTVFKFTAMYLASKIVPDATHCVWVDFGAQHIV